MYLENGGETAKGGYTDVKENGWYMMNNSDYNTSVSMAF
jgi:hypothetical protein